MLHYPTQHAHDGVSKRAKKEDHVETIMFGLNANNSLIDSQVPRFKVYGAKFESATGQLLRLAQGPTRASWLAPPRQLRAVLSDSSGQTTVSSGSKEEYDADWVTM